MSCYFKGLIHILLKSVGSILGAKAFTSGLEFSFSFKEENPGLSLNTPHFSLHASLHLNSSFTIALTFCLNIDVLYKYFD